jgi:hypothetical protein
MPAQHSVLIDPRAIGYERYLQMYPVLFDIALVKNQFLILNPGTFDVL